MPAPNARTATIRVGSSQAGRSCGMALWTRGTPGGPSPRKTLSTGRDLVLHELGTFDPSWDQYSMR